MMTLLEKVELAVKAAIGTTTFADPTGSAKAPRYYLGLEMPDKRDEANQDIPFCWISPGDFTLDRMGRNHEVVVKFGLYSSGDKDAAMETIDTLLVKLLALTTAPYAGYKLLSDFRGSYEASHPFYTVTLTGDFRNVR